MSEIFNQKLVQGLLLTYRYVMFYIYSIFIIFINYCITYPRT